MPTEPLKVVWISDFPVEWLEPLPACVRHLPRRHPATWAMVLLEEFRRRPGLDLHVVAFRRDIPEDLEFRQDGVTFHVLKAAPVTRLLSYFWLDTVRIRRLCERIRPDLIHAWGSEKGAGLIASRLGRPYVFTIQGLFAWYARQPHASIYERAMAWIEAQTLTRSRVVTTESNFAVAFLKDRFPHLTIFQAEHAPNHCFRNVLRAPAPKPVTFLVIGGLGRRKGTDLLLAALDQLRELEFKVRIITNPADGYVKQLRATVSAELWQRLEFHFHVPPKEVAEALQTATLLLMPTRADTSPNAVKEAVVAGVPVVASEVGGIPDYVAPGHNGILFRADDVEALVTAIRQAVRHPLFGAGQVDPESLIRFRAYLSPERMAENFLKAYDAALEPTSRPR